MTQPTVYIETTIVSYLTARPSRDLVVAGHQQVTADWWEIVRPRVECFVSPFVIQEVSRGDKVLASRRLAAIQDFPVLAENVTVSELAVHYFMAMDLPERAKLDAFHLASAAAYGIDYLLSWNCRHIASGQVQRRLQDVNQELGIRTPILCTPESLMEI